MVAQDSTTAGACVKGLRAIAAAPAALPRLRPCPVPRCGKAIGPSGILCRDHYRAVPTSQRKALHRARRAGDESATTVAARACIATAGG